MDGSDISFFILVFTIETFLGIAFGLAFKRDREKGQSIVWTSILLLCLTLIVAWTTDSAIRTHSSGPACSQECQKRTGKEGHAKALWPAATTCFCYDTKAATYFDLES